ncbi:MAG: 4-hydroxy-3-methylbut-2-enyl diphosphate reductase [Taibaiella sp.]|nr:4-hydroxy-3-methylbut-2-enyl diphosphate reductase [Taibaiella sp.]
MKSFEVPIHYRSPIISAIKQQRKQLDKLKKDFAPSVVNLGNRVTFLLSRHFGFCYGVENAIEIAFRAVKENPDKRIFLLSEMIHNPQVNADLISEGVNFIMDTKGKQLVPWEDITENDIVIIPAFGTTLEIESILKDKNIEPKKYNTTCPFVEKVWNRSEKIGNDGYGLVVHGKPNHEETRATFSHAQSHTPTVVVKDLEQTKILASFIKGERPADEFYETFAGQYSNGFDIEKDMKKIGVVNQTTMLASDTQEISNYLKEVIREKYQLDEQNLKFHFADTRDTLCYATNDNQTAVQAMLENEADLSIVIGGYNSSNTSHLVELSEEHLPTYFINHEDCIMDHTTIRHFNFHEHQEIETKDFLPQKEQIRILITSGASCPDALVERVMIKLSAVLGVQEELNHYAASLISGV